MTPGLEVEIQRYAVLALANLATEGKSHPYFINEGMLPKLVGLLRPPRGASLLFPRCSITSHSACPLKAPSMRTFQPKITRQRVTADH